MLSLCRYSLRPASSASTTKPQHNVLFARPRSLNSLLEFVPAKLRSNEHVQLASLLSLDCLTTLFQLQCYILVISTEIRMSWVGTKEGSQLVSTTVSASHRRDWGRPRKQPSLQPVTPPNFDPGTNQCTQLMSPYYRVRFCVECHYRRPVTSKVVCVLIVHACYAVSLSCDFCLQHIQQCYVTVSYTFYSVVSDYPRCNVRWSPQAPASHFIVSATLGRMHQSDHNQGCALSRSFTAFEERFRERKLFFLYVPLFNFIYFASYRQTESTISKKGRAIVSFPPTAEPSTTALHICTNQFRARCHSDMPRPTKLNRQ